MNYEVVNLTEKKLVGLNIRTNNNDPDMGDEIEGIWKSFFEKGVFADIKNKVNERTIGLYSNYESDFTGDYDMTVACEVSDDKKIPNGTVIKIIPSGKYAKFIVRGNMQKAVYDFWQELWNMDLERAYTCDFEEYINEDAVNSEIYIYISLK